MSSNPLQSGAYVPSTYIFDIQQLQQLNLDPQLKELLIRLYQNINNIILVLNVKNTGLYGLTQLATSQQYFPNPANNSSTTSVAALRQVFRLTINFGALPNAGTKSVAHNLPINLNYTFTQIYGTATQPNTKFIPLPYASATAVIDNIELNVDTTNVNVTTGANYSAYTVAYIVLEFLVN